VYLVFLIGSLLFSSSAGLISAGLLSVTLNHIYISRVGMQESYVIFFLLLASYLFLRAVREGKSFIPLGAVLGLALLTKYNAFILFPILGTYLFLYHRALFRRKDLWLSLALALVIFSPVIIYNIMLYKAVGHFDFQFSYVFGQNPKEWQVAPGKEIGSLWGRAQDFFPRLIGSHSWLFLALSGAVLLFLRNPFMLISLAYLLLLISVIGPAFRFLTMLTPFFALSSGAFLNKKKYLLAILIPVLLFEIFYSVNNQIVYYPKGPSPWLSSKIRYENYNWGYNELGAYFEKEFARKIPATTFHMRYAFIEKEQDVSIKKGESRGYLPYPALIVTHGNFDHAGKLWMLDRLSIYHGWPMVDLATYLQYLRENGADYYERSGFRDYYFVEGNIVPDPAFTELVKGLQPNYIHNPRGEAVFTIYERHPLPI
ncbi:MAG: glycosyltransferase family 39 protein, partial [bacterium]|nr:glycosyltransferase family 39 protein [bacterium]